jgi:hypothetical protein
MEFKICCYGYAIMTASSIEEILAIIAERFAKPFVVDDAAIHYAESTLGVDQHAIMDYLNDDEYGMMDLIVYPELSLRKKIEGYIPRHGFTSHQVAQVIERLCSTIPCVAINVHDTTVDFNSAMCMPSYVHKLFLMKNNIPLDAIPAMYYNRYIAARVAIRLYNTDSNLDVLHRLAAGLASDYNEDYIFDSIQVLISVAGNAGNIFDCMALYKYTVQKQILAMHDFNELMKSYSMEYLMSMRYNPPMIDAAKLEYQIRLIDSICMVLFGKPAPGYVPDFNDTWND